MKIEITKLEARAVITGLVYLDNDFGLGKTQKTFLKKLRQVNPKAYDEVVKEGLR